jgi:YHS domain-containing protein
VTRVLLLAVLMLVVAWAFWKVVGGVIETFGGLPEKGSRSRIPIKSARDPVCGTWVSTQTSLALRAGDKTHYFCSDACRAKFAKGR